MIIDFKELSTLVPEKGSLILTFKRNNGNMTVCYAPRYDGKEENSDFRPVTVTGTPEELNNEWNRTISEIAKNERLLVASSASNLSKRKSETEKALSKTSKTGTAGSKKTDDSNSASDNNLFTPDKKEDESKKTPAENKAGDPEEANENEVANTDPTETSELNDSSKENEKPQELKTAKPTIF